MQDSTVVAIIGITSLAVLGVMSVFYSKDTTILVAIAGLIGSAVGYSYGVSKVAPTT